MALIAEELVEEWLRRQGYFTIRGIRLGVHEIDLLAVKNQGDRNVECRHIEVQASMRPVSFISKVPKAQQRDGRAANSAKRSTKELATGVEEWVHTKFKRVEKISLMQQLWRSNWSSELVLNVVKSDEEVALIQQHGVRIIWLKDVVSSLSSAKFPLQSASGSDFVDLICMGKSA
jgi:Holliday junction resolvase-like predicted endonuclease